MQNWKRERVWAPRPTTLLVMLLLGAMSLAGCGRSLFGEPSTLIPAQVSAGASNQVAVTQNASLMLEPASGYGGLYVQVRGEKWPQNMMVLVTLEDDQGRSETLAASDTDQAGNLTTGFLFPIEERWLASESPHVVTTTADGRIEAKAKFTVVAPGEEIIAISPEMQADAPEANTTEIDSAGTNSTETNTTASDNAESDTAKLEEEMAHKVILPLVASSGVERTSRSGRSSSSAVTQIDIAIEPGRTKPINCRNQQQWITLVIYSRAGFDATSVDAGSVIVASGSTDVGVGGNSVSDLFVAFPYANTQRNLAAQQWRWHLEDVDGDGNIDMVMEIRLGYTQLTCNTGAAAVTGRTQDGRHFAGSDRVNMRGQQRG